MEQLDVPLEAEGYIRLPAEPSSAVVAREFVRGVLRAVRCRSVEDAAVLCVSELVTNVALHTGSSECIVKISNTEGAVSIEVTDESPKPVTASKASLESESGRGLQIIDALSRDWGVTPIPDTGKSVWLRLSP